MSLTAGEACETLHSLVCTEFTKHSLVFYILLDGSAQFAYTRLLGIIGEQGGLKIANVAHRLSVAMRKAKGFGRVRTTAVVKVL